MTSTQSPKDVSTYEKVGEGLNVYESDEVIEGRVKWLETPDEVISFVEAGDDISDVIVVARGGTTTFLAMALNAGVRGIVTLQGAPESHLGILSREYGIPCIMSVEFTKGIRTSRGETIPADGVRLSMDVSSRPGGIVSVEPGAPVDDSPPAEDTGPAMSPEQMEQIQILLANYQGEVPAGVEGDAIMQSRLTTNVLDLDDPKDGRDLTRGEANDFLRYLAWNEWDALAARATEGESGLIPRQEYEAMGIMDSWFNHPVWLKAIQDRIGAEGVSEMTSRARNEIGTKINLLHLWACAAASSFGRGIALELGLHDFDYRGDIVTEALTTARRMYKGLWGSGPLFASMREYKVPVLDPSWIERFESDRISLANDQERSRFQRFNGATELLGFLVHFDNRLGLGDSGPYPTADGGFVMVRDLFINEPVYEWSSATQGLPYAVTIAMFFDGDGKIAPRVQDLSTMFSEPANYLPFVKGVAVYTREEFDTPMDQIRTLTLEEMDALRAEVETSSETLYKKIAKMSEREKIMAGSVVYSSGFFLPFARAAGMFDELVAEHGLMSISPATLACYDTVISGVASELMPRLFLTGSWANEVPENGSDSIKVEENEFEVLHAVRVRGFATPEQIAVSTGLSEDVINERLTAAAEAGFVKQMKGRIAGARLTPVGRGRLILMTSTRTSDEQCATIEEIYDAFLRPNQEFKTLTTKWQTDKDPEATGKELDAIHETVVGILARADGITRLDLYRSRFGEARDRFVGGDHSALAQPMAESYHDVWMELHEDLLASLGRERSDQDG